MEGLQLEVRNEGMLRLTGTRGVMVSLITRGRNGPREQEGQSFTSHGSMCQYPPLLRIVVARDRNMNRKVS